MASLNSEILIKQAKRPCYVLKKGKTVKKAMFHLWVQRAEINHGYHLQDTFALVEYEDGCCENVYPWEIKFADGGEFDEIFFKNDN